MANVLERQITLDGRRNAVVKLTGVLDSSDAIETPAIALSDLLNNEPSNVLYGLRVDLVEWSMSGDLEIALEWNSNSPQQILPLAGRGRISGWNYGGFIPDASRSGYDGAINLRTASYDAGTVQNFTVVLELVKLYR